MHIASDTDGLYLKALLCLILIKWGQKIEKHDQDHRLTFHLAIPPELLYLAQEWDMEASASLGVFSLHTYLPYPQATDFRSQTLRRCLEAVQHIQGECHGT